MSNNVSDLNNTLFEELDRLSKAKGDGLKDEIKRSEAITKVASRIAQNYSLNIQAKKVNMEIAKYSNMEMPKKLESK